MIETAALRALGSLITEMRVIESDFPASYAAALIYIARHRTERDEWPSQKEVAANVGISTASISRAMQALGDRRVGRSRVSEERPANARKALKLVEQVPDEFDLRKMRVKLTDKGWGLLSRMSGHLG